MKTVILNGFVKEIIYTGDQTIIFSFIDEVIGEVCCRVHQGENQFFYEVRKDLDAQLTVRIQGRRKKRKVDGFEFLDTYLTVVAFDSGKGEAASSYQ